VKTERTSTGCSEKPSERNNSTTTGWAQKSGTRVHYMDRASGQLRFWSLQ